MKRVFKFGVVLGTVMSLGMAMNANAAGETPAQLVKQSITHLQDQTHGKAAQYKQHPDQLRQVLDQDLSPIADFPRISAMVMGRYYRLASPEQRERFATVFKQSTLQTITQGLLSINYDGLEVNDISSQQRYDNQADVSVNVRGTNGQTYPASFTMIKEQDNWKVINVIVNGINLGLTFRNQFDQAMRSNNRDFDKVIDGWDPSSAVDKIQNAHSGDSK